MPSYLDLPLLPFHKTPLTASEKVAESTEKKKKKRKTLSAVKTEAELDREPRQCRPSAHPFVPRTGRSAERPSRL